MTQNYDELLQTYFSDIYRCWRNALDTGLTKLEPALTLTEWHILGKLQCRGPKMTQQALAEYLFMDPGQLTRVLRQLENKGMIKKTMDNNDRRIRHIELASPKAEYIENMMNINKNIENKLVATLSDKEQNQLKNLLDKVRVTMMN